MKKDKADAFIRDKSETNPPHGETVSAETETSEPAPETIATNPETPPLIVDEDPLGLDLPHGEPSAAGSPPIGNSTVEEIAEQLFEAMGESEALTVELSVAGVTDNGNGSGTVALVAETDGPIQKVILALRAVAGPNPSFAPGQRYSLLLVTPPLGVASNGVGQEFYRGRIDPAGTDPSPASES